MLPRDILNYLQMPPKLTRQLPPIPTAFTARKATILASLVVPSSDYKDLSPKGSVDEGIVPLIEKINTLDGIVTTSSCAGRVSVFLEGRKSKVQIHDGKNVDNDEQQSSRNEEVVVAGGKGNGGRWLFVSHEPVDLGGELENGEDVMQMLGITGDKQQNGSIDRSIMRRPGKRLVRFQFEPMILHIMTASLAHASPILTAAINAGFRESGVQSLKNLDDPSNAFPMVAVRTSGLALESVIGYLDEHDTCVDEADENIHRLVDEDYLIMLLGVANERFQANKQRKTRFEDELFSSEESNSTEWETRQSRQARKRADGLTRQHALKSVADAHVGASADDEKDNDFGLLMD